MPTGACGVTGANRWRAGGQVDAQLLALSMDPTEKLSIPLR
ncbi:hypothetical protein [Streptomyces sp. PRh5]|nr:hypothetical protein [Streptomyces sp. PRh5]